MSSVTPNLAYTANSGASSTRPFITVFETRSPNAQDVNYAIQQVWINTNTDEYWTLESFSSLGGVVTAVWSKNGSGSLGLETFTGNSGGAVGVDANHNINTLGTGSITIVGSPSTNTLTTELTGLTDHAVLVGAGTPTITKVGPDSASGIPLISQGSSTDPVFGTALVPGGGTASTSFNINGAVYSNTTTTGALQSATLTDGQLLIGSSIGAPAAGNLTSNGGTITITNGHNTINLEVASGKAFSSINNKVFTYTGSSQTYTPTVGMTYCSIQCLGGGGGGGGTGITSSSQISAGSGGGSGEYAVGIFSSSTIGASQTVTIGAAGAGVAGMNGSNAGNTSVGSLISANGGGGGILVAASSASTDEDGGPGGTGGSGGDYRTPGSYGQGALACFPAGFGQSGQGASSQLGAGGFGTYTGIGGNAGGYGAGGGGSEAQTSTGSTQAGGNGSAGVVIITEYIT